MGKAHVAGKLTEQETLALPEKLLAGLTLEQSGRFEVARDDVGVRAYPFPYRAALAISNDCDSQSADSFRDWHAFTNGSKPTQYGDGLGLEIGDSFWVYGRGVEPAVFKGNPFDPEHPDGYALDLILEYGRLGWLDTLHSFGNWALRLLPPERAGDPTVFSREQLLKGLDRLDALGLRPYCYTNHSGSPSNVGGPWAWYQGGDDPNHGLYCLDLLRDFGIRYFWIDNCTQMDKFGENLAFADEDQLRRAAINYRWLPWLRLRTPDGGYRPLEMPDGEDEQRNFLVSMYNRPLIPVKGQDGRPIYAFKRYRDIDQPVESTFSTQVTAAKLDALEAGGGNVVVYQHIGVFGPRGRAPAISRPHRKRSPLPALSEHGVATWQEIAERKCQGRLFVATVGRLLDWLTRRDTLQYSVERSDSRWIVTLEGFDCPVQGRRPVEDSDLNGLAFTVPSGAPQVEIVRPGRSGTLDMKRTPDPVNAGLDAVYIDWAALEWPE